MTARQSTSSAGTRRGNGHGSPGPGAGLVLEFASSVASPLLGQLSHFGYGIFVPDGALGSEIV